MNIFEEHGINLPTVEEVDEEENPTVVCKFTAKDWEWYIIGGRYLEEAEDFLLFGLVNGYVKELGFFMLHQLLRVDAKLDENFRPVGVYDIFRDFDLRRRNK